MYKKFYSKLDIKEVYIDQLIKRVQRAENKAQEIHDIKESFMGTQNEGLYDQFIKALKKINL